MDSSVNTIASDGLTRVFVSYAREDKKWLDPDYRFNLIPFLIESLRKQNVVFWFDKELRPGDEFRQHIEAEIDQAQIALLIVSQAFLNSEFIEQHEMSRIENRAKQGQMIIVPVLVEPCDWSEYPILADRQMVPGAMPLIDFTESDPKWAKVKSEILDGLKTQIKRIRSAQKDTGGARQAEPAGAAFAAQPEQVGTVRPAAPKGDDSKSIWRKVPAWGWVLASVTLVAVVAVVHLSGPHADSASSPAVATTAATQQAPSALSSIPAPTGPAVQQPAQQPTAQAPAVHAAPSAQDANPAALKEQADAFFNQARYAQAEQLYFQLCMGGNGPSCNRSGYMYQNGLGVQMQMREAANLYTLSCTYNFPNGCSNLGNLYRQGLGVPKNLALARQFLTKGCSMGNQFGCDKLKLVP